MSRRKQAKPQCVHMDPPRHMTDHADFNKNNHSSQACEVHVCEKCFAEFLSVSDLHEHQMVCSKNPLVLIVSGNGSSTSLSPRFTFNSTTQSTEEQTNNSIITEETDGLYDKTLKENRKSSPVCDTNSNSDSNFQSDNKNSIENQSSCIAFLTSNYSTVLPQLDYLPKLSKLSSSSNVVIENLQSTKVAVAQFSQDVCLNAMVNSSSDTNCTMTIMSLFEQLVAVQQQQVQQLKHIEQIRQHILLLSAQNTDTSAPSTTCQGTSEFSLTGPLITLSTHLSQQLAHAAGLAKSLVSQSASFSKYRQLNHAGLSSKHDSTALFNVRDITLMAESDTSKLGIYPSVKQSDHDNTCYAQPNGTSQSLSPVSPESPPDVTNIHSLPQSPTENYIFENSSPSIGAIVEDLNALTALAQQRKGKLPIMTSFGHKRPFDEGLFKHKCRFCAKVFGSDSALQIHVRSHTGERPYKCNICGNRFSTRGNLKVHFQRHKEKYPNIQMNPYPVPEHLDNVPTSTGIPYGMSMLPDKPASKWLDSKPSVTGLPGLLLTSSLPSLPSIIKREAQVVSVSRPPSPGACGLNGFEIFESKISKKEESRNDYFTKQNVKYKELQYLSTEPYSNSSGNSSEDHINTINASNHTLLSEDIKQNFEFEGIPDCMDTSETTKLQQLVEKIDRKSTDPNECMICHRVLSCQSALKMHYRTHTGERPFKCKICGRAFTTKGNLKTHYSIHCTMPPLKVQHSCPICQEKYTNAIILQQHIRMHMVRQITNVTLPEGYQESVELDKCSGEESNLDENLSDDSMEITERFTDFKDATSSQDSLCSFPASSQTMKTSGAEKTIQEKELLNGKVENASIEADYLSLSDNISWSYLDKSYLGNGHASQRSRSPAFPEITYSWESFSKNSLLDNYASPTFETQQKTSDAEPTSTGLTFNSTPADILKGRMTIKSPSCEQGTSKSNGCDVCNKTFACQSALDIHYRSHTKERPFLCTACDRGFSTKGNLKQHMLTHQLRDLPLQLSEQAGENLASPPNPPHPSMGHLGCSKIKMEVNSILNKNGKNAVLGMMTSSAPLLTVLSAPPAPSRKTFKQHFCRTCGKMFSSSSALQIHERTHTGEKPFACTVCARAFTTKGNLKVHMGTHMWNGSPARRGRRLSVEGPFTVLKSNPVRIPDLLPKETVSNSESAGFWNQYVTAPLTTGLALKTNEISVIQNGSIPLVSLSDGRGGNSPIGGLTASLEKAQNIESKRHVPWIERLGENASCFYITPFIEESKTD